MGNIPDGSSFPYATLFTLMQDDAGWAAHTPNQQFRIILAISLGTTIFVEVDNHRYFHYLVNLVDLGRVRHMNWGVAAYATLTHGIRSGV